MSGLTLSVIRRQRVRRIAVVSTSAEVPVPDAVRSQPLDPAPSTHWQADSSANFTDPLINISKYVRTVMLRKTLFFTFKNLKTPKAKNLKSSIFQFFFIIFVQFYTDPI